MELKTTVLVPVLVGLVLVIQTLAVPLAGDEGQGRQAGCQQGETDISADKRPKYMDTRELQDAFKSLILSAIQELVVEGQLNTDILPSEEESKEVKADKRGRQGLCWRRSNGKVRPFFCWRRNDDPATDVKRGNQGLCYRRISQNRVMPYVCWKNN